MKTLQKILISTLLLLFPIWGNPLMAKPKKLTKTITWELTKGGTLFIHGSGEMPDFKKINSGRTNAPWNKRKKTIKSLVISEGITRIGDYSFGQFYDSNKKINNIKLPSTLESIGKRAFYFSGLDLSLINWPKNLHTIEDEAFVAVYASQHFHLPSTVISWGEDVFSSCSFKRGLSLPSNMTIIPEKMFCLAHISGVIKFPTCLTTIGRCAFMHAHFGLGFPLLPNSVKKILDGAFNLSGLTGNLILPKNLEEIGDYAFAWNELDSIYMHDKVIKIGHGAFFSDYFDTKPQSIRISSNAQMGLVLGVPRNNFHSEHRSISVNITNLPDYVNRDNVEKYGISRESYERYVKQHKTYKVGDYYNKNGKQGVVFWVDTTGEHGKIVSVKETELAWCSDEKEKEMLIGANSKTDGAKNMAVVKQRAGWRTKYPAFAWCADLGDGWYLPAYDELKILLQNETVLNKVNSTLEKQGFKKIYNANDVFLFNFFQYWTSTELKYVVKEAVDLSDEDSYLYYFLGDAAYVEKEEIGAWECSFDGDIKKIKGVSGYIRAVAVF